MNPHTSVHADSERTVGTVVSVVLVTGMLPRSASELVWLIRVVAE